jgi:orotate phosphoribosyltransferase
LVRTEESVGQFFLRTKAVRFGDFVLKSGRRSNVFFDVGLIYNGADMLRLGEYLADFMVREGLCEGLDVVFGPAYKGINLAIATSIALSQRHGLNIPFAYNRKEKKDHAEGGRYVGYDISEAKRILIVDDVLTDGGSKYELIEAFSRHTKAEIAGILVGVDRQEIDEKGRLHREKFEESTGIPVYSLTNKAEVLRLRG